MRFLFPGLILLCSLPASGAKFDLSGTWSFSLQDPWNEGVCPAGAPATGSCEISQNGDSFTLVLKDGVVCAPAAVCTYEGTISDDKYEGANEVVVDNEGGKAKNVLTLTASSAEKMEGSGESTYIHPGGMTCKWGFNQVVLTRGAVNPGDGKEDAGPEDGGLEDSAPVDDAANPMNDATEPPAGDAKPTNDGSAKPSDDDSGCGCTTGGSADRTMLWLSLLLVVLCRRRR